MSPKEAVVLLIAIAVSILFLKRREFFVWFSEFPDRNRSKKQGKLLVGLIKDLPGVSGTDNYTAANVVLFAFGNKEFALSFTDGVIKLTTKVGRNYHLVHPPQEILGWLDERLKRHEQFDIENYPIWEPPDGMN